MCLSNACCDGIRGLRALLSLHITFTFMHLADTFTQSDLQSIQAIHFFHQYVMHLWGICIIIHASQSRRWAEGQVSHPCVRHFKLSQDVLRHVVFSHRIHHEILISGWTLRWPVLMALFLMDRHNTSVMRLPKTTSMQKASALAVNTGASAKGKMNQTCSRSITLLCSQRWHTRSYNWWTFLSFQVRQNLYITFSHGQKNVLS